MSTSLPAAPEGEARDEFAGPLYTALRLFGFVVLGLICVSIVYACWIMLVNWGDIRV